MNDDCSDVELLCEEEAIEFTYSELVIETPISIEIPPIEERELSAHCSEAVYEDDEQVSRNGSAPLSLLIPASVESSPMITTRSLGSRSSFGDFPSHSSSISLSSDQELVNLACISLRQAPVEVQALDLSTNTRKPRRPLKNIKALSELTNLVHLDLSGNAVERLDGLQIFTQLQTLAIPRNNLKTLAASLFTLRGLTHLDLSGNFIAHLPRAFSGLKMLEQLNLSGNNLGTLREVDVLAPLSNLLSCNLAANPFCRLPTYKDYVICKIRSLERLDDAEISRVARDRAAKRFSNAIFSQDACLREAGRAHEDEQNRLLEAQSALEAENLRLKGELQVKSKLLQNKSRAWSSATEQLLQLQQEVAMLNLDRRRSVSLSSDHANEAEQIAVAIAARHKSTYLIHQRPQSAPRLPSPKRSVEKRRGSFSYSDEQLSQIHDTEDDGDQASDSQEVDSEVEQARESRSTGEYGEKITESRDAACMPMSPVMTGVLKRGNSKMLVDASCSPLRVIPPVIITKFDRKMCQDDEDTSYVDSKDQEDEARRQEYEEISSPPQTWDREEMSCLTRTTPPSTNVPSSQQQHKRRQSIDQVQRVLSEMDPITAHTQRIRPKSTSLDFDLPEDEPFGMSVPSVSRSRFPTFEDDTACPAYEDTQNPLLQTRSSSASALCVRNTDTSYGSVPNTSSLGSHSLPPSPASSPSRIREWYRKQKELRLMTPPPSPPRANSSPQCKPRQPVVEASPLAPFVDKDVLARQIQALQSCKQSLLTEIRNEEHLVHVLKQESAQYADQIDCLSVNIQACLDGDPSSIRFSFSPPGSPRNKSKKLQEETGRARLEILRNKLRFAEDKEKEIETTMVRMTKRVLHADLNPSDGKDNIREKFSPVDSSKRSDVPFDKEIFALTHKLQLVIVEKEEIHMQMSQLMAQLRGQTTADMNLGDDDESGDGISFKQAKSLAKSRQLADELRTRHREVSERILLKEKRIASLLEELKEIETELKQISSLNASSALSPLFQRERAASLEFLQAMRSQRGNNGTASDSQLATARSSTMKTAGGCTETPSTSSPASDQVVPPITGSTEQSAEGGLPPANNELLSPNMLDEIKADIYAKLSQQLAPSTGKTEAENSVNKNQTDFHQAIASALENRLQLGVNSSQQPLDVDGYHLGNLQQNYVENGGNSASVVVDTPPADDVCCGQFDEFAPVETYYARKYVMAKDRISSFVKSISDDEGNISSSIQITSAQRILKICERLEAAEAKSSFDPVSKIEVDQQGNSRGSLKIMLLAARDLPTAHLRTKNLDPYVCFEVVYPSHAIPPSFRANSTVGKIFRSQTKKKSIYPVWEEDFEVTPILSLNGFLHVRVLNDRRLSREQLVGEVRIPLQTLVHQKRIVDWFSLGLNVPPASGNVVSKLCGGAVRLQLQLYFSSVERYKHVVDELVVRYLHDHSELPPFIDAVDECENRMEQEFPAEQPEQSTTESPLNTSESMSYAPRRQMDVESHFPLDELATSLPSYTSKQSSPPMTRMDIGESSIQLNSNTRVNSNVDTTPNTSTQLSPERRKSLWETKTLKATTFDDKKAYFGFSATTERRKQSTTLSMSSGPPRRSQTPTQSKRIRNAALQQHVSLRRKSVETPECFDEYSPYHPGFKSGDVLDACNNEHGGVRNGRTTSRSCDPNRKTDLSIFKSPSLTRRPPSSGFPERYIGLDNQTCERLKRIFGRMDSTS